MFPIGCATGCYQAAWEAEFDVCALLHASDSVRSKHEVLARATQKYVGVAVLAFVDVLIELSARTRKTCAATSFVDDLSTFDELKKAFHRASQDGDIEKRLRRFVRNTVSAHRVQQTVESISGTHAVLTSAEFGALLFASRRLLYSMGALPVWFWGRSLVDGGIQVLRVAHLDAGAYKRIEPGLSVPAGFGGSANPMFLSQDDLLTKRDFRFVGEAEEYANAQWGLQSRGLDCCGCERKRRH